jgi:hypothetical protein
MFKNPAGPGAVVCLMPDRRPDQPEIAPVLSKKERTDFEQCESIISQGLKTFFQVGNALLEIRERRLFRGTCSTFEEYCRTKWGLGRIYAWRLIGAAERLKLLPPDGGVPLPTNEFQVRPFLKLPAEDFPEGWHLVLKRADAGKITSSLVNEVIGELSSKGVGVVPTKRPVKRSSNTWELGKILVLIQQAKQNVVQGHTDEAIRALDDIEHMLFLTK